MNPATLNNVDESQKHEKKPDTKESYVIPST